MSAHLSVGELLDGKYRILRVIGEGGWGVVYEGEHVRTLKRVAIKMLRAHAGVTPDIRARFEREAQAGGRIGSDHIVEVFDLGTLPDGTHFMVMELLSGEDLAKRLRSAGRLEPVVAVKLVMQLLDGLAAAHGAGVLHRDLKPENLFLVPTRSGEDFVKILDFGVSKFSGPGVMSATRTGAVLGSPYYMAPEQARGLKHIDGRTDLYSVGALLFECLTGRVPFEGENFNDLMFKIALAPRPNPLHFRPELDQALVAIVVKSIAADPRERFATADEFRAALAAWVESQGQDPAHAPELRQPARLSRRQPPAAATPTGGADRGATPAGSGAGGATGPGEAVTGLAGSAAETPMVSSSGVGRSKRARRRRAIVLAVGASAALAAAGTVARRNLQLRADAPVPAAAATPFATPAALSVTSDEPASARRPLAAPAADPLAEQAAIAPAPAPTPITPAAPTTAPATIAATVQHGNARMPGAV
ncbi:MAG TPA: serine/threonine-protein kinase, partial [Polyangiaceae bacterium]|nr:serine/threonine-protein kinase [Polyangiaceae bacterium]